MKNGWPVVPSIGMGCRAGGLSGTKWPDVGKTSSRMYGLWAPGWDRSMGTEAPIGLGPLRLHNDYVATDHKSMAFTLASDFCFQSYFAT